MVEMEEASSVVCATIASAVSVILLLKKKKKRNTRKKRIWQRSWIARRDHIGVTSNLIQELKEEDKRSFKIYLRMDNSVFEYILSKVAANIAKQDTHFRNSISPRDRLLVTLRFLATGETYSSLQFSFRIPQCTLTQIIPETCKAIYESLKDIHLKIPNTEREWESIAEKFENRWNVYNCIGALDGKHISITCPPHSGSHFYNYKLHNSIVLLALADANYKFIYVDAGTNGRIGDSGVFAKSKLRRCLNDTSILNIPPSKALLNTNITVPYVVLADDVFPLTHYTMKPYSLRNITTQEKIFNYRLSRGRQVIECAFGILASRFRVLLTTINLPPATVQDIVLACCTLHNLLIDKKPEHLPEPRANKKNRSTKQTSGELDELIPISIQQRENTSHGTQIRKYFKYFYNGVGSVPWQNSKI